VAAYGRVTWIKSDPAKLDDGITNFRDRVVPAAEQASGFMGATLQVDRERGLAVSITFWESLSAMNSAEQLAQQLREQAALTTNAEIIDVDRFEIVAFDAPEQAKLPGYARIPELYVQPERVDALIDFSKTVVHPRVREYQGFRAFVTGINRMTGRTFVSIGFDSPEARAATEDAGAELRAKAAEVAGASTVKVDNREVVFAKIVRRPDQS
jgi:hypothetical protein